MEPPFGSCIVMKMVLTHQRIRKSSWLLVDKKIIAIWEVSLGIPAPRPFTSMFTRKGEDGMVIEVGLFLYDKPIRKTSCALKLLREALEHSARRQTSDRFKEIREIATTFTM